VIAVFHVDEEHFGGALQVQELSQKARLGKEAGVDQHPKEVIVVAGVAVVLTMAKSKTKNESKAAMQRESGFHKRVKSSNQNKPMKNEYVN